MLGKRRLKVRFKLGGEEEETNARGQILKNEDRLRNKCNKMRMHFVLEGFHSRASGEGAQSRWSPKAGKPEAIVYQVCEVAESNDCFLLSNCMILAGNNSHVETQRLVPINM